MTTPIKIIRGDSKSLGVTFSSNGTPFDITGYSVFFTVKRECNISDANDDNALISKKVTVHSNPTAGVTAIPLTTSDTNQEGGIYYWDLQLVSGSGAVSSTQRGEIEFTNDITKRVV